jgi:hypothetical protein
VSYYDVTHGELRLIHCTNTRCAGPNDAPINADDSDLDGCLDGREEGPDPTLGGLRNSKYFWDFYDVPTGASLVRDRAVSGLDLFAVLGRFNTTGSVGIDPLSLPPATGYHTAYDRGSVFGPDLWDLMAANGSIAGTDIFSVLGQFGHSCP